MATYSKYTGTYYETISSSLILSNSGTQSYAFTNNLVYTDLLDNTLKLIEPKSIRNAILSVYDTIPFKETSVGNNSYIGIDNGDPSNMDLKRKIYLGKRYYSGSEIMDSTLLLSNTDLFIYNTRSDIGISQDKTSVVFLAGTDATLNENAPKLQSELFYDKTGAKTTALNLLNTNGDINVISKGPNPGDSGATVSVNNIVFPAVQDSDPLLGGVSDNKVLLYNNGSLTWSDLTINDVGYYGATGTTLPIYGNPTYLNGHSLEFTDNRYCPIDIGDINLGDIFNNVSISSILERIIYDYLNPLCTLSLYNTDKYFEVGSYPNVKLNYSITKRTNNTLPTALSNMIPNSYPAITSNTNSYVTGVANGIVISPIEKDTTVFSIKVSDGTSVSSASASVSGVYPYFYGFTSSTSMTTYGLSTLNKKINTRESSPIDIYQTGLLSSDIFYFIYDYDYGYLSSIKDQNNNNISSYFTNDVIILSSPSGLWASKKFRIYKSTSVANDYIIGYAYPNNQGTIIFNFNFTPIVIVTPPNTVTAASSTPTICVNSTLTPITHNTTGATGIAPTSTNYGLPTGITAVFTNYPTGGIITISGTPTTAVGSPFNYIIPLTGGLGSVNATGTITININTVTAASSSPTVTVNTPITPITHTTTGATGIMSGGSGLPTGVTAIFSGNSTSGTITISGTPTTIVGSPFNYSIVLAGGCGLVYATGTITVDPILIQIGSQFWSISNSLLSKYSDGTTIPYVDNATTWSGLTTGAWCYYNNDPANEATYGKLYNWYAIAGIYDAASLANPALRKQFAPVGYHVPSQSEYQTLITYLGGSSLAGVALKEAGITNWQSNPNATNSSGFKALPGGIRYNNGAFSSIRLVGNFWTSTEFDLNYAWYLTLVYYNDVTQIVRSNNKKIGLSVKFIKD